MDNAANLVFPPVRTSPGGVASQPRGRVLVVEDNPINQRVAVVLVTKLGFSADVANDGSEAVNMIVQKDYRLILMDCQMPVMDGFEATRAIREMEPPIAGIPIIAITANVMEGQRDKCLAAGMNEYLAKPINKELLAQTIDRWVPPVDSSSAPPSLPAALSA